MPQNYIIFSENKKPPLIFSKISRETCPKSSLAEKQATPSSSAFPIIIVLIA